MGNEFLKTDKIIYRLMKLFKSEMKIFSRVDETFSIG
jgi:hypothetical protein